MGVLTFTEEGVVEVPEDDLAKWLASDEAATMRPAGSGPDGRWTVEDEKAAFRYLKKNDKLGTEPYDVLADRLVNAGYFSEGLRKETTRKRLAEKYPDASRIDVDKTGQAITYFPEDSTVPWQKDAEDRSIYDLSDGSTPKTFEALANGAARAAYNRDNWPGEWTTSGFGEWKKKEKEEED